MRNSQERITYDGLVAAAGEHGNRGENIALRSSLVDRQSDDGRHAAADAWSGNPDAPIPDHIAAKCLPVEVMTMTQIVAGYDKRGPFYQPTREPPSECSSLAVVTGFLDAALRLWDNDRVRAKSHIKVAVGILRDHTDDAITDAKSPAVRMGTCGLAPWQACKIRKFIESSLQSTIRLKDCASSVKLSASYFSHAFKVTFGTTVCHYIRCRRVERAQRMMLSSREPLSQVALACGFADQAHYSRVFRGVVGLSPNAWRRRNMMLAPDE